MYSSRLNSFIVVFTVIFVVLISTLVIYESLKIDQLKKKSLDDFVKLKNNFLTIDNSIFPSKMKEYFKTLPELTAFRIIGDNDKPVYFYTKTGLLTPNNSLNLFNDNNSIYKVIYNHKIILSNNTYKIEAAFIVLTQNDIYSFIVKLSIFLIIYLLSLFCLMIIIYSGKNKYVTKQVIKTYSNKIQTEQKITDELKKSASFDQDIVLTLISSTNEKIKENESDFYNLLKKNFPFHDLIFRFNENIFGILLPNMDLEKGIQQMEKFDQIFVSNSSASLKFPIMFGLSSRNGRLISGNIILKEAKAALNKAFSDKNFPIIGFRPNPARYREYLTKLKLNHK